MTRFRVFQLRLLASGALLLLVFGVVRLLWYPGAYFAISGAFTQYLVLAAVVIVVGPVLSAFVYKPGKKGLSFDLWVLAGVELLAVMAAGYLLFQRQPHFAVFAVDRFEAVSRAEVDTGKLQTTLDSTRPGHAPRLVYAKLPDDPEVHSRLIDETVFYGMADIDRRPEFWEPYTNGIRVIRKAARPLDDLLQGDDVQRRTVAGWLAATESVAADYIYLPLRGRAGDATIILHADTGFPVATLAIDPW
jgi:hypothetical protein